MLTDIINDLQPLLAPLIALRRYFFFKMKKK